MKKRLNFVSDRSSCSFIITNKSNEVKTLVDFVKENPQLIENYKETYGLDFPEKYTQEYLLISAEQNNETLVVGPNHLVFGDERGSLIDCVFDYILRDGGESENFNWYLKEMLR